MSECSLLFSEGWDPAEIEARAAERKEEARVLAAWGARIQPDYWPYKAVWPILPHMDYLVRTTM
jgi:hypothetical protein